MSLGRAKRAALAAVVLLAAIGATGAASSRVAAASDPPVDLNADVHAFNAPFHGDTTPFVPAASIVGMAVAGDGGYWLGGADGGVFNFGSAEFLGSLGELDLDKPIVGMAGHPSGDGFWMVASDGGVFAFGVAGYFGSLGGLVLDEPIVGMAAHPSGQGYWLVASDGGIFTFGEADFFGSMGGIDLKEPVVEMAAHPDGAGYWLVASDGGIFTFGQSEFYGSTGAIDLDEPIVDMAATASGDGYWLAAADGGVFTFGGADYYGSAATAQRDELVVDMERQPSGAGYWLIRAAGPRWPLTGLPAETINQRPTLAVKIDNHPSARGQWGLLQADVVFEELVEGGATRFIAVFHSQGSSPVGPIRSARETDLEILPMFGKSLLVYSGGNSTVRGFVNDSEIVEGISPITKYYSLYYRTSQRSTPHNLMSRTERLWPLATDDMGAPPAVFEFRLPVADEVAAADTDVMRVDFGTQTVSWQWNGDSYVRSHGSRWHWDASFTRISAQNVLVLGMEYDDSPATGSPVAAGLGSGRGMALIDGATSPIEWSRESLTDPFTLLNADSGDPVLLAPGRTWVELAPEGLAPFDD